MRSHRIVVSLLLALAAGTWFFLRQPEASRSLGPEAVPSEPSESGEPAWAAERSGLEGVRASPASDPVAREFSFLVKDSKGGHVSDATVSLSSIESVGDSEQSQSMRLAAGRTDESGKLGLAVPKDGLGLIRIRVAHPGYVPFQRDFARLPDEVQVTLEGSRTIRGSVFFREPANPSSGGSLSNGDLLAGMATNSKGAPAANVVVLLGRHDSVDTQRLHECVQGDLWDAHAGDWLATKTDANGRFEFEGVFLDGALQLWAGARGYASLNETSMVAPGVTVHRSDGEREYEVLIAPMFHALVSLSGDLSPAYARERLSYHIGVNAGPPAASFFSGDVSYVLAGGDPALSDDYPNSVFVGFSPIGSGDVGSVPGCFFQADVLGFALAQVGFDALPVSSACPIIEVPLVQATEGLIDLRIKIDGLRPDWLSNEFVGPGGQGNIFGLLIGEQTGVRPGAGAGIPREATEPGGTILRNVPFDGEAGLRYRITSLRTPFAFPNDGWAELDPASYVPEDGLHLDFSHCGGIELRIIEGDGTLFDGSVLYSISRFTDSGEARSTRPYGLARGSRLIYPLVPGKYTLQIVYPATEAQSPYEVVVPPGDVAVIQLRRKD